jgi:cation diffusion facilitator family transporter
MNREKSQIFEGVLSIVVNAILFVGKLWAGMVTGSVALMADAWHTISDSLSSLIVVVSAKVSSRKPDRMHPFGHGRLELIGSLIIVFILGIIGYEFLTDSIERFQSRESVAYGTIAIVITVISVAIKEALAQYAFYLGRKHDSTTLLADGWHHRTDSASSVIVLIGIIITRFIDGLWWMDSVLGILCALAIFYAAFQVLKETVSKVLGEEPKQEMIDEINSEVNKMYDFNLKLHHFHLHDYISQKELTLHMMVDKDMTVETGHDIATAVEDMIKEKFDIAATVHIEPLEVDVELS